MYIEGLGYIDDSVYNAQSVNSSSSASTSSTSKVNQGLFEQLLANETATLNQSTTKQVDLDSIFKEASEKYNVSIDLLKAVAKAESNFDVDATSHCGAMGIMQLMPATAKSLGVEDAYDPYQNIMGGAKFLSQLSKLYDGDMKLTLAAYNAGSGNVAKYNGIPPFKETQNYVVKVMGYLDSSINAPEVTVSSTQATSTASTEGVTDSFYTTSNLDDIFSYDEYEILMKYYEAMLDIIANIGDTDGSSSDNSGDDSLADLFRLGGSNIVYNKSTINL